MISRLMFSFLITCFAMLSPAQTVHPFTDSTIMIIPHWQKGEIKNYEILQKTKVSFYSMTFIYKITQTVDDVNDSCMDLEWRYDTVKQIDSMPMEPGQTHKASLQGLLNGKTIRYRTDLHGRVTEVLNFKELSGQLKPAVDSLQPSFMHSMMPQFFGRFLLKDILIFHQMYGRQMKSGDTTKLSLKYSIKPDIQLTSGSISTNFKNKNLKPGVFVADDLISIEGRFAGPGSESASNSFTYNFLIPENLLLSYSSVMQMVGPEGLITIEDRIGLRP